MGYELNNMVNIYIGGGNVKLIEKIEQIKLCEA